MIYRHGTREKPDRLSQFLFETSRVADAFARPSLHDAPEQAPADDDAMRPEPEEPSEGVKQALSDSFLGRFVSRYRRAFFLASITVMTFGWGMRGFLPEGVKLVMVVAAWSIAAGIAILAVRGVDLLRAPTSDQQ